MGLSPSFRTEQWCKSTTSPLMLPELKNIGFSTILHNPLNLLCLLDEKLKKSSKTAQEIKDFFGYSDDLDWNC
ncbi:MAG: hypothetical protein IPI90_19610 [Saprospiraceae bacterium]|nr:hypothetical protein [Candidatus Vicinibacter affinis]